MESGDNNSCRNQKKIWVRCHRYDTVAGNEKITDCQPPNTLSSVVIGDDDGCKIVTSKFQQCFDLPSDGIVMKLRNNRQSLIPMNGNVLANSKTVPYNLEVMKVHQFLKPTALSHRSEWYKDSTRKTIEDLINRVDALEAKTPELRQKRLDRIHQEMVEMNQTLAFMDKRFDDVEGVKWEGMFTKHPLW